MYRPRRGKQRPYATFLHAPDKPFIFYYKTLLQLFFLFNFLRILYAKKFIS